MSARVVILNLVGATFNEQPVWPEGWPVPQAGDEVEVQEQFWHVRHVVWYPSGEVMNEDTGERTEPFVYVVIGPRPVER